MSNISEIVMTLTYHDWTFLNTHHQRNTRWVTSLDDPYLLGWFKPLNDWIMCRLPES